MVIFFEYEFKVVGNVVYFVFRKEYDGVIDYNVCIWFV